MGWVLLSAAAEKSPELWRPELAPREELCHLWLLRGWDISPHQQQMLLSHLFHSICSSRNRKLAWSSRLTPPQPGPVCSPCCSSRRNGSALTPHPWDSQVSSACAAKNVKWLCLIWFALCPEQAFDYLYLTNPLYNNHRAKGDLGLWGGELRKASLYNSRQICFVSMWDCPINLLNILVLQCFLTAHTFG